MSQAVETPPRIRDISGSIIGEMVVVGFGGYSTPKSGKPRPMWVIRCSCGVEKRMLATTLRNTKVKSCGHLQGCVIIPNDGAALNLRFHQYKSGANKRGLYFALDKDEFERLLKSNCIYCGAVPSSVIRARGRFQKDFIYNGIDRIDNDKGYTAANCAPCCAVCNLMKRAMPASEFLNHVRRIVVHTETTVPPGQSRVR